jgi:hypothetical protein
MRRTISLPEYVLTAAVVRDVRWAPLLRTACSLLARPSASAGQPWHP